MPFKDDGPDSHECSHNEIISASNTVSDLLMHRKNSGSFLKSYYLLTYACSDEGQELLRCDTTNSQRSSVNPQFQRASIMSFSRTDRVGD